VLTIYFVNVPGIRAAGDIIDAFQARDAETMMRTFERALERNSFANQEIREQLTRRAQDIIFSKDTPPAVKDTLTKQVETELLKQIEEKPGDARAHVFIASFYRSLGTPEYLDKAVVQLERARELSPKKQQIIFEQGLTHLQKQSYEEAYALFKEAFELDTSYMDARVFYAMSAVASGKVSEVAAILDTDAAREAYYMNDLAMQVTNNARAYPLLETMIRFRIEKNPTDPQIRTSLAYVLNESGKKEVAIAELKKAGEEIPSFAKQAQEFIVLLQGGVPKP
jgi:tetratricopeptide (TPR) repeat protein